MGFSCFLFRICGICDICVTMFKKFNVFDYSVFSDIFGIKNFILFQRLIRPILSLKQHRSRFKALQAMPLPLFYIQNWSSWVHIYGLNYSETIRLRSSVVPFFRKSIQVLFKMSANANAGFTCALMSMNRHYGSRLQSIQHPLAFVFCTVP